MMDPKENIFKSIDGEDLDAAKTEYDKNMERLLGKLEAEVDRAGGNREPREYPIFKVGDEMKLRGYVFKVKRIEEKELVFEPVGPMPRTKTRRWSKKKSGRAQKRRRR
jgi:hypothetical protein